MVGFGLELAGHQGSTASLGALVVIIMHRPQDARLANRSKSAVTVPNRNPCRPRHCSSSHYYSTHLHLKTWPPVPVHIPLR